MSVDVEEERLEWSRVIKRDRPLEKEDRVCSVHFKPDDVITHDEFIIDGNKVSLPRTRATHKKGAKPIFFENYPPHLQPKQKERRTPKNRDSTPVPSSSKKRKVQEPPKLYPQDPQEDSNYNEDVDPILPTSSSIAQTAGPAINEIEVDLEKRKQTDEWDCLSVKKLTMPVNWVICNTVDETEKFVVHIDPKSQMINKSITFKGRDLPTIKIRGVSYNLDLPSSLKNASEAQKILEKVNNIRVCGGTGMEVKKFSMNCEGGINSHGKRCKYCNAERERQRKISQRKEKLEERKKEKQAKAKSRVQSLKRSKQNLILKVQQYQKRVNALIKDCGEKKKEVLNEAISKLPEVQQEAVKACFESSRRKGPSGRRYTTAWVYECMLMRIKDKKLYNHIRNHEILPLPALSTINGYLKHYGGTYGFQPQTLELLKEKTSDMPACKRRGTLLIDEMKLTPGAYFDTSVLKVGGFKDMGESNLEELGEDFREEVADALEKLPVDPKAAQKKTQREKKEAKNEKKRDKNLGDHALVMSFQPFQGKWVQAIACFLTRGNATDEELTKLILEAVILLEKSNLLVDAVVNDGATWNRAMWKKFGVSAESPHAEHPCDEKRRLYFFSDFPHLMKCMRNCMVSKKIIPTPTGDVKLSHWKAIVEADKIRQVGLRECHKLTADHLNPDSWQKMNCRMAWEFWSRSAAAAMESFRLQGCDELDDCQPSIDLCIKINDLADAMNSNRPFNALKLNTPEFKAIEDFLDNFINMKKWADEKLYQQLKHAEEVRVQQLLEKGKRPRGKKEEQLHQENYIFSDSTDIGLIVSLKNALELTKFLINECDFTYVMTARFNQDALERFFGLMRQSCGGNTHPEPRVFAQLFRLLSVYSLVKPLRGSNITGGEMVTCLLNLTDLKTKTRKERHDALSEKLDEIILNGEFLEDIGEVMNGIDHDYLMESVDEFAVRYVAGFVARHSSRYIKDNCVFCSETLKKPATEKTDADLLITVKSKGFLTYPSDQLVNLTRTLEAQVVQTALAHNLEENILFEVLDRLDSVKVVKIGCAQHDHDLTKAVMKFYLITRMHFIVRRWNEKNEDIRKKAKGHRKQANLT